MRGSRNKVLEEEKQLGEGLGGMGLADSSTESSRGRCTDMPPPSVNFQVVVGCPVFPTEAML